MTLYYKVGGSWVPILAPYLKKTGTWQEATELYYKTGGVWTVGHTISVGPPNFVAGDQETPYDANSPYRVKLYVQKNTDSDLQYIVFAGKEGSFPANPTQRTGTIINSPMVGGHFVAGNLVGQVPLYQQINGQDTFLAQYIASDTLTYVGDWYPNNGAVAGGKYYFGWWQQDTQGQLSTGKLTNLTFPAKVTFSSVYIDPTYSASWLPTENAWSDVAHGDNHVYQGGASARIGQWYYGNNIYSKLAGKTISKMQIFVFRNRVGIQGKANIWLSVHQYASRPTTQPETNHLATICGFLNQGEGQWLSVPSAWWQNIANAQSGSNYRGLGLYTTFLGVNGSNDVTAAEYNQGVSSGKLYVEYHD